MITQRSIIADQVLLTFPQTEFKTTIALGKTTSPGSKDEHTDINITTTNVQIVPMDKADVAMFNDPSWHAGIYSGFGKTDWTNSYLKDVTKLPQAIKTFILARLCLIFSKFLKLLMI